MDIKRAKQLTQELDNLIDKICEEDINKLNRVNENLKNEIRVKVLAILNELNIRSGEIIEL